jgi:hypothetical protein
MAGRDFSNELFGEPEPAQSAGKDFSAELFGEPAPKPVSQSSTTVEGMAGYVPRRQPAPKPEAKAAPTFEPVYGDDVWAPVVAEQTKPKRESVMEGVKLAPPTVDYAENRRTRDRSGSPESVMFTPARQLDEVDAQIYAQQYKDKKSAAAKQAARDKLRQDAAAEDYGVTDFFKDSGIDLTKGVAGLGEAYVGLLDITSGGAAGRVLGDMGYSPKRINKFLTGFQSLTRKNQDKDVEEAQGFLGTLKELSVNPASLVGSIVESIPGTLTSGVAAGRYVRFLTGKASTEALAKGLVGAEAEAFIKDRVMQQTMKIAAVASGTEGAQTTGSIAEAGRQAGKDWNEYVLPALAAGFGTTAIGLVSGKAGQKFGIGDIETGAVGTGSFRKRFAGEVLKEGLLEELPQSAQEQIFRNIATGRPWDEKVDKASAQGLAAGMGMAAANASKNQAVKSAKEAIANRLFPTERERVEPTFNDADLTGQADQVAQLNTRVEQLRSRGVSEAAATRIAKKELGIAEEPADTASAKPTATNLPDVSKWTDANLAQTLAYQEAKPDTAAALPLPGDDPQQRSAKNLPLIEAIQAEIQKRAATTGEQNVGQTIAEPSGAGVSVVEQPNTVVSSEGLGSSDGSGVVSTRQDVAGVDERASAQSVAVDPKQKRIEEITQELIGAGLNPSNARMQAEEEFNREQRQEQAPAQTVAVGFREANQQENKQDGARETLELGNGAKVLFASDGDTFVKDPTGKEAGVIRSGDTRQGIFQSASELPAYVPEAVRQLLMDYANAARQNYYAKSEQTQAALADARAKLEAAVNQTQQAQEQAAPAEVDPIDFAKRSADTAIATQGNYQSLEESIGANRDNIADTLREQGVDDQQVIDKAIAAYDEEIEKQTASAAEAAPKGKRGPKGARLTAEEKEQRDKSRTEHGAAYTNDNNRFDKNKKTNLVKELEKANQEVDLETIENEKALEEAQKEKQVKKDEVIDEMLGIEERHRGRALGNRVKAVLNDRSKVSQADLDRVKKARETRKKVATGQNPLASQAGASKGKPNTAFNKATNASQALTVIAKTGNMFQRFLANRLRGFVGGVKFVVVEQGDAPTEDLQKHAGSWATADAMYVPDSRTVYVRGASFGDGQGVNNITVLHEILHAATNQKIALGLLPGVKGTNPKLARFINELINLGLHAEKHYKVRDMLGLVPAELKTRVESTLREDGTYGIFEEPQEFLAYGMSDEAFQEFLGEIKGAQDESGFTTFVRTLYNEWAKAFGKEGSGMSAMSDLINITGKILDAKKTPAMRLVEKGLPPLASQSVPPNFGTALNPATPTPATPGPDERTQAELDKAVNDAERAVLLSEDAEQLGRAVSALAATRNPSLVWDSFLAPVWDTLTGSARSFFANFYDADGIAKNIGKHINGLGQTYEAMQQMHGMERAILDGVAKQTEQIIDFFRKYKNFKKQWTTLVLESTHAEYDPSDKSHTVRSTRLDEMYNTLPPQGQKLYRDYRDYYKDMNAIQQDILEGQLSKLNLPKAEQDRLLTAIRQTYEKEGKIEPYFPLVRMGDYILELGKGRNRISTRYDTPRQRDRAMRAYAKRMNKSVKELVAAELIKQTDDIEGASLRHNVEKHSQLLKAMYEAIEAADPTSTTDSLRQQLKDQAYQAYLATMPEGSVRKMFMHRKGTPGFSVDLLRNTNEVGLKMARQFARLKYAPEIQRGIEIAKRSLQGAEKYTSFVQRMEGLAVQMVTPQLRTGWDRAAAFVTKLSFYQSLTSFATAVLQPLEILTKGISVMWGNHGVKGIGQMLRTLNVFNTYGVMEPQADGTWKFRAPSIEHAKGISADERAAVRQMMIEYGATSDTILTDIVKGATGQRPLVYRIASAITGKEVVGNKAIDMLDSTVHNVVFGGALSHADRVSREFMFLASYRANKAKGMTRDEAIRASIDDNYEIFGNYSTYNRPLWMQTGPGRFLGLYRFFPLITIKLLGNNFKQMLPLLNKEGKAAAAKKFFGVLGMTALLAGPVALPMFSHVMAMAGQLWNWFGKDPDAPDDMKELDYKLWWRTKYIPELLGDMGMGNLTDLFLDGALNKMTGVDLSSRISLNDLIYKDVEPGATPTETVMNYAKAIAGAGASSVERNIRGVQEWVKGDYQKGFETMFPASITKPATAMRLAEEGTKTPEGVQLTDPGMLPKSMLVGQALGFRPAPTAKAQENAAAVNAANKRITIEKTKLSKAFVEAYRKSEDMTLPEEERNKWAEKFSLTIEKAVKFSERHPEAQFTSKEINDSINEALGRVANKSESGGIETKKKTFRWAEAAIEANKKLLAPYKKPEEPEGKDYSAELFGE